MRKLLLMLSLLPLMAGAQAPPKAKPPALRIAIGMFGAAYSGDLNYQAEKFYRFYPGINGSIQFGNKKRVSPQMNMGFGRFIAQNRHLAPVPGYSINKYVETTFFYADFRLKIRPLRDKTFSPYASLGPELFSFTPKDEKGNALSDNFETRKEDETYSSIVFCFPLSLGFDLRMNSLIGLGFEYTYRATPTDYLDNIGALGTKKGNDRLHTFMLNLHFTIDPEHPPLKSRAATKERI